MILQKKVLSVALAGTLTALSLMTPAFAVNDDNTSENAVSSLSAFSEERFNAVTNIVDSSLVGNLEEDDIGNGKVTTKADSITVLSGPGMTYASTGTLDAGTVVTITGEEGNWYTVAWDDVAGFVSKDSIKLTKEAITETAAEAEERVLTLGEQIVATAKEYLGCPYSYGSAGPSRFDCSGFVQYIFSLYGIDLAHSASAQKNCGTYISTSELQPGDLVFFYGNGHVGIYIGNGYFIHASTTYYTVTTNSIYYGYWAYQYSGARRILN